MGYRQRIIAAVTFLGGLYFVLEFILPAFLLEKAGVPAVHSNISNGFIAFGVMAVGLGIINLFMVHGSRIVFVRKNWFYSVVLLTGLVGMMSVAIADWVLTERANGEARPLRMLSSFAAALEEHRESPPENVPEFSVRVEALSSTAGRELFQLQERVSKLRENEAISDEADRKLFTSARSAISQQLEQLRELMPQIVLDREEISPELLPELSVSFSRLSVAYSRYRLLHVERGGARRIFNFLYEGFIVSLGAAMFSLLGVYIAAAAFRAFRIRNIESVLMMSAAIIVMLGQIPFHSYLAWDLGLFQLDFPFFRYWLMQWPNGAAFRAIVIGAEIAGLIMAFRMWLSIESKGFEQGESPKN